MIQSQILGPTRKKNDGPQKIKKKKNKTDIYFHRGEEAQHVTLRHVSYTLLKRR